jgi:hypothetical protein
MEKIVWVFGKTQSKAQKSPQSGIRENPESGGNNSI